VGSVQHVFHHVVIKIRQLFLRPAACLTSTLLETGINVIKVSITVSITVVLIYNIVIDYKCLLRTISVSVCRIFFYYRIQYRSVYIIANDRRERVGKKQKSIYQRICCILRPISQIRLITPQRQTWAYLVLTGIGFGKNSM
jgi:hypothetical protein